MYQFSRGIYRELAPFVDRHQPGRSAFDVQLGLLRACEASVERLATDRHYFAHPARTLFGDIRCYFPVCRQEQVYQVVERYMALADEFVASLPANGVDPQGNPAAVPGGHAQGHGVPARPAARQRVLPVAPAPRRDRELRSTRARRLSPPPRR